MRKLVKKTRGAFSNADHYLFLPVIPAISLEE